MYMYSSLQGQSCDGTFYETRDGSALCKSKNFDSGGHQRQHGDQVRQEAQTQQVDTNEEVRHRTGGLFG